jgi:hypothetical protein
MVMRLAFALAVHVDADLLIVDEALAVGDIYFRQRCLRRIHELRDAGVGIVFVSHDMSEVRALGHRTLWLRQGAVEALGETREVTRRYLAELIKKDSRYVREQQEQIDTLTSAPVSPPELIINLPADADRDGDGRARVLGIAIVDSDGCAVRSIRGATRLVARVSVRVEQPLSSPIIGVQLRGQNGVDFAGANTAREQTPLAPMVAGQTCTVDFYLEVPELPAGRLTFSPAIADGTLREFALCDMVQDAVALEVRSGERPVYGQIHIPCSWVRCQRAPRQAGAD